MVFLFFFKLLLLLLLLLSFSIFLVNWRVGVEFGVMVCFYGGMECFLDVSFAKSITFIGWDFSFSHYWR